MRNAKEYTFASEQAARDERRKFIGQCRAVSLLSYDPSRNLYVFDAQ